MLQSARLGLASLRISTKALESGSFADDSTYTNLENLLTSITNSRNAIAAPMSKLLEKAAFQGQKIDNQKAEQLIDAAGGLLKTVGAATTQYNDDE
jgi:hypothetical protein